jgi:hypothetical protein
MVARLGVGNKYCSEFQGRDRQVSLAISAFLVEKSGVCLKGKLALYYECGMSFLLGVGGRALGILLNLGCKV